MNSESYTQRKTFAIISHPDAGKTTVTEKMLLLGKAIQMAGTVRAKKSGRQTTSDWMAMERERGISVTTSVMQFLYKETVINLLDTPGHADFSEDTYRTLTAVDSTIMVVDGAKGVEPRTRKLIEVCRMRDSPVMTLVNKLDRESLDALSMIDHLETELNIECVPLTWPIGSGRSFLGIYRFDQDEIIQFKRGHGATLYEYPTIQGLYTDAAKEYLGLMYEEVTESIELVKGACNAFDMKAYQSGQQSPVFFGSALQNFGITDLLDNFVALAPGPQSRVTDNGVVTPESNTFSGFIFKIQANMNPKHRDRIAFLRICSGVYRKGMKMKHVRLGRELKISDAVTFMAGSRTQVEEAYPGDIIGLHNHGTIRIGDTFTQGSDFHFRGIPSFAPELFKKVRVKDPTHAKRLKTGMLQLSEEGVTQIFNPITKQDMIVGAIGVLQFELVVYRLQEEYGAECIFEPCDIFTVRWVTSEDATKLTQFSDRVRGQLAVDGGGHLTFLATSRPNLQLVQERWPEIQFAAMRELATSE